MTLTLVSPTASECIHAPMMTLRNTQVALLLAHDSRPLPHQLRVPSSLMLLSAAIKKMMSDAIKVKLGVDLPQCLGLMLVLYWASRFPVQTAFIL